MKRRNFLKALAAGAATIIGAAEVDLDRILWVPGHKTIFLPPAKPLVSAFEAQRQYNAMRSRELERVMGVPAHLMGREIRTAAGRIVVDVHENVVSLNGRRVGAQEAARLRLTMFNPRNPVRGDLYDTTCQIVADRVQAGWQDPVGPGGMPQADFVKRKIVLEGA